MIHHVYANRSNVGDWLAARGIQRLLPTPVEEHLCDEPFVTATLAALSKAEPDDLILIGGGGLFMDYFSPFWDGLRRIADRVPIAMWGLGVCDLKAEPSLPPWEGLRDLARKSRLCVVRDELTRKLLGVATTGPPIPCPSLCAVQLPLGRGHGVLHVDNYTTVGAPAYERMDACAREFATATDRPFLRTNNRIEPGRADELDRVLALYERADVVVTSALHGCVIAVALGRPVVAVSGDRKIEAFMEVAGLAEWTLDAGDVDALDEILERIDEQPRRSAFVAAAQEANREVARAVLELAFEARGG